MSGIKSSQVCLLTYKYIEKKNILEYWNRIEVIIIVSEFYPPTKGTPHNLTFNNIPTPFPYPTLSNN